MIDSVLRAQIWADLYEMERACGRAATYVVNRHQQFDPGTGKYLDPGEVRLALSSLPSFDEDISFPTAFQSGRTIPQFVDFQQGDKIFLLSTRLLDATFEPSSKDWIEQDGGKFKFHKLVVLNPQAGYIIHGRRGQ